MFQSIDRRQMKAEARRLLRDAQVSAAGFFTLFLCLTTLMDVITTVADSALPVSSFLFFDTNPLSMFLSILSQLMGLVLGVGCYLYCMAIRRSERVEYLALFDGFSLVGKIILLYVVEYLFIVLWSMLFFIPGIIAMYRYRFAILNLCENPELDVMEALRLSKQQTYGYKLHLLALDLSYIGWALLASLPNLYFYYSDLLLPGYTLPGLQLPGVVQVLICGVFTILIAPHYLPQYETTEIGYFELAKQALDDRNMDAMNGSF